MGLKGLKVGNEHIEMTCYRADSSIREQSSSSDRKGSIADGRRVWPTISNDVIELRFKRHGSRRSVNVTSCDGHARTASLKSTRSQKAITQRERQTEPSA